MTLDLPASHLGIGVDASLLEAQELDGPRRIDSLADECGGLSCLAACQLLVAQRRHLDLNVNAVQERTRNPGTVALYLKKCAAAFFLRVGKEIAGARVHGCDYHADGGLVDRSKSPLKSMSFRPRLGLDKWH